MELPKASEASDPARRRKDRSLEGRDTSENKKKAENEKRTLLYIDESGFYLLPAVTRTYAPIGETPILRHKLTRDHLSVIGAVTPEGRVLFDIREKSFNSAGIIEFLEHLKRQVPGDMLLLWDGAPIHRSKQLKAYLAESEPGRIHLEMLPGYAPEVNPQESIWYYLKYGELKNLCCYSLEQLREELLLAIKKLRRKKKMIQSFFEYAEGALQT